MSKAFSLGVLLGAISDASAEHRFVRVLQRNNGNNGGNDENPWIQFQGLCIKSDYSNNSDYKKCVNDNNNRAPVNPEFCSPDEWDVPSVDGAFCKACTKQPDGSCASSCQITDRDDNLLFAIIECTPFK